jgi:hypothetical protein
MRSITIKPGLLVPFLAIAIAMMALAFWAAMSLTASASSHNSGNPSSDGFMSDDLLVSNNSTADHGWETIPGLSGYMKKAQKWDMVVDVSLECSLMTQTEVKSKGPKEDSSDTSTAQAGVYVRVLVDGVAMEPGEVTFCRRSQTLSAQFQGFFEKCITDGLVVLNDDCLEYEELNLILDTTNANAFNFVRKDLDQGTYHIKVQTMINSGSSAQNGTASAYGVIGKGSAIVHEVHFANTK